jgi:purine-binding chemotaxis protein CheW
MGFTEHGRAAAAENTGNGDQVLQWVTFDLAGETYGIDVMAVKEVLRHQEIAPVPGATDYTLGIINIRGRVISVISTRRRFGLPDAEVDDNARIMIVEIGDYVIGIVVDSVAEVVYIKRSEIDTTPSTGNDDGSRFIQGVCQRGEQLLILLDLEKMISQEELAEIDQR